MGQFTVYDAMGKILRTGTCPDDTVEFQNGTGEHVLVGKADSATQYIENGVAVDKLPKPSLTALFDYGTKAWYEDYDVLKQDLNKAVTDLFASKSIAPLSYAGSLLHSDQTAVSNLKSKLQEISARIELNQPIPAEQLLWKCADNTMVTFTTQDAYKAWLQGFAIALSERGTSLYMAKWQHQNNIKSVQLLVDIIAYDINIGWPA